MEQTNELSENERAIASELNETNEICEMSEQLVSMLRDEAEIIWSEADGSIYYTTKEASAEERGPSMSPFSAIFVFKENLYSVSLGRIS